MIHSTYEQRNVEKETYIYIWKYFIYIYDAPNTYIYKVFPNFGLYTVFIILSQHTEPGSNETRD